MKRIHLLCATVIAVILWGSCSKDIAEDKIGGISGSVSDQTTGEPVPTVNVTIAPGGNSTVTGNDGSFSFPNLEPGEYTLTISKEGYKAASSTVTVRTGDPTPVHLLIGRSANIVIADRDLLDFGENESTNTLSFNIVNPGYEDLGWTIEHRVDWIAEVKPAEGVLKYGKTEGIVVVIDRNKLEPGENEAVIVIRSLNGNGSSEVKVIAQNNHWLPVVTLQEPVEQTIAEALLNGKVVDAGNPPYTERGFVYATAAMPTIENGTQVIASYSPDPTYSGLAKGLILGEHYYIRAYAKNSQGIAYSTNEIMYTPAEILPQVITEEPANLDIKGGKATFKGKIVAAGDPAYTERGFVYSTLPEPTIYDNKIVANGSEITGSFSTYVTGLPTTDYYMRAYATNSGGTAYGEEQYITLGMPESDDWVILKTEGIAVQKQDIGQNYWSTIDMMCKNSTLGGYTDWRLPTQDELMKLYLNQTSIGNFKKSIYWSSSLYSGSYYYIIDFYSGSIYEQYEYYKYYGRCVRTL